MVASGIAVRAEIGGVGCAGALCLRLWRRGGAIDRSRSRNRERASDKGCPDQTPHDGLLLLIPMTEITGSNLASFKAQPKRKQARNEAGLCEIGARLSRLPAVPVTMVMAMAMMPAVMVPMPPMHFRGCQPGVVLNRRGGAGIAERQRIGALGRRGERQQRADSGESQNFRELHQ